MHLIAATAHVLAFNPLNGEDWITAFGGLALLGIAIVLFAETGLLVGFFLPGDSLLFAAGLLCTTTTRNGVHLNLATVIPVAAVSAVLGAQTGFYLGVRYGRPMIDRSKSGRVKQGAERSEHYFTEYGRGKAIVIARFVPIVRTVMNPMAGILEVPTRIFTLWNVVGGVAWTTGVILAGYWLGSSIPSIDKYLLPIVFVIIIVSLIPIGLEVWRARKASRAGV